MNLGKKTLLAIKTLKVGKEKVFFVPSRLDEIKEAITKQDIRDLVANGAIIVKPNKGRKKVSRKKSRSPGNIRKKVIKKKQKYVKLTRKLRKHVKELKTQGKISREDSIELRKRIRNKAFKSKSNLKEHLGGLRK